MTARSPAKPVAAGFCTLAAKLAAISPKALQAYSTDIAALDRGALIDLFRLEFGNGRRERSFLLAQALTNLGVPPCLRLHHLSATDFTVNEKFDLMTYDLQFLRREYPEHERQIRFKRCKGMFVGSEAVFHNASEFAFYRGDRPAWKIVKSLSLTEEQQLDCFWLQSAPIAKRRAAAQAMRNTVFEALQADLRTVRRTKSFTDEDAKTTLFRRHRLWLCRGLTTGSTSAIAKKYTQLVGITITPQIVARQLQMVDETLRKSRSKDA
jgi:hypothetical protein